MSALDKKSHYVVKVGANMVPVEIVREVPGGMLVEVKSLKSGKTFTTEIARLKPFGHTPSKAPPPAPAEEKAPNPPAEEKPEKKMSLINAAAQILKKEAEPMTCGAMVDDAQTSGLWSPHKGLTPAASLNAAIRREIKLKGADSRFAQSETRGKYLFNGQGK